MRLELQPITFRAAADFVNSHHRHHVAPVGHKYSIGLTDGSQLVGVVIVGRPVARGNDDGLTLEVTRLCVLDGIKDACSKLYAAAWRVARNLGYRRLITYTLSSEPGTSLRAAGWKVIGETQYKPRGWDTPSRPRQVKYPTEPKIKWEVTTEDGRG